MTIRPLTFLRWGSSLVMATALTGAIACTTGTDGNPDGGGVEPDVTAEPDPDPEGGTCEEGLSDCRRSIDCEAGQVCERENEEDEFGCCIQILCVNDTQCDEGEVCDLRRGICINENTCDPANPQAVCQPGEFCIYTDGLPQCVDAGEIPVPEVCTIAPNDIFARDGDAIELQASGALNSGALVPGATFTFASDLGTVTGNSLVATCDGPAVCTGTVTVSNANGTECGTADLTVYPTVPETDFRVLLFEQGTSAPLIADVAIKVTGEAELQTATTDATGAATFTGVAAGAVEAVSTFPDGHAWNTYLLPATNDVAMYTAKIADPTKVAGVKGNFNFDNVSTQGDIQLGLSGMSIGTNVTDLDFSTLLGEIADYEIELEGVTNGPEIVPLPSGLVLELGATDIKGDFVAFGEPGKGILWALGGKVRLADIGPIISSVTDTENVNVGSILSAVLPFFAKFDHAVVTGLDLVEQDRPAPPGPDQPVAFADWPFDELTGANAVNLNTLLGLSANYDVPVLPCVTGQGESPACTDNAYTSGAVLISGVIVPGQGIVPLGLTAGLDDPDDQDADDQVDGQLDYKGENTPGKGEAIIDYAPPHDGLEGNINVTLALALDINGLTEGSLAASSLVHITDSYGDTNNFPQSSFLEHQGGTFTRDNASPGTRTFAQNAVGTADYYRLNLDSDDGEWNVYYAATALPTAEAPLDLNAIRPADKTGRDITVDVQAFRLGTGYSGITPAGFTELIEFNGTNFDNIVYYMGGWSSLTCEEPSAENAAPFCSTVVQ